MHREIRGGVISFWKQPRRVERISSLGMFIWPLAALNM